MSDLARAFASAVDEYERGRPGYPPDAVAWLAEALRIGPGRSVLDLGAGTGKLTRLLVAAGARVLAVDPLPEMLAKLGELVPEAEAHLGRAEEIPLPDAAVDAVTIAQAFHWLDTAPALRELHRVLRGGGGVGILWNRRDESNELEREVSEVIADRRDAPARDAADPAAVLPASGLFDAPAHRTFTHVQELDEESFVDRFTSVSYVAAAPPEQRERIVGELRAITAGRPRPLRIHYVTHVFVAFAMA